MKLVFFDFCETLVSFQTGDAFVDYVRLKHGNFRMKILDMVLKILWKTRIISALNKIFPDRSISKRLKLLQLRGFSYEELNRLAESYYTERIKPRLILPVMDEIFQLSGMNYEICLVSAGYSIYLKYFAEEHDIRHLISTEIGFRPGNKRCLGTICGKDCIRKEKVRRIMSWFADSDVNYNESIAYSDSTSDLPLLLLAGKGVVVSRGKSQPWIKQYGFKEIIWN